MEGQLWIFRETDTVSLICTFGFLPVCLLLGGLLEGSEGGGGVAGLLAAGGRGEGAGGRGGHAAAQVAPPLQRTFGFVTLQGDSRARDKSFYTNLRKN